MLQENKRIKSAKYVRNFQAVFACPICHSSMEVLEYKSLICFNQHTFDFAKQGYINFLTRSVSTKYSKELFEARKKLLTESAFFDPVIHAISKLIDNHAAQTKEAMFILDTGCGEGSHLSNICELVRSNFSNHVMGFGIDISKEGIMLASKNDTEQFWAVADLANTPFKNTQFDIILNILSPSNYAEFNRLLKVDGLFIKVVPQSDHLRELREYFYRNSEKKFYSNVETVDRFNDNFQLIDYFRVSYTMKLPKHSIGWLLQMTPLTWNATEERIAAFLNKPSDQISVDLQILIGKKVETTYYDEGNV